MTKFIDKTKDNSVKTPKQTVFKKYLAEDMVVKDNTEGTPVREWEVIEFIGRDRTYGDVFKAYISDPNDFVLFFGEKGDEFD